MSKKLAKAGFDSIKKDLFKDKPTKFKIAPPNTFDFFNSLKLREFDSFAGVTVAVVDSIFWETADGPVSQIGENADTIYSGSADLDNNHLPPKVNAITRKQWLVVASYELKSRIGTYENQLEGLRCTKPDKDDDIENSFFMFLRGANLLAFDERKRETAEMEVAAAPDDPYYKETSYQDLLPYYEIFQLYEINDISVLKDKAIFWFSYIVAAYWANNLPRHLSANALFELTKIYNQAQWHFPIDNARTAVVASHFKHCFIELYRCLEWLYSIPQSIAVKKELNLTTKATLLAKTFRTELSWRRSEADSLRLLLRDAKVFNYPIDELNRCLNSDLSPKPDPNSAQNEEEKVILTAKAVEWENDLTSKVAARIYKIRNQFVHQVDEKDTQQISTLAEPHLIKLLCWLCAALYPLYQPEF